jgi:hypothetical protein
MTNAGDQIIDFMLETKETTRYLSDKSYTWIKCNRYFQGFYITQYTSELSTISSWQRFSSLIEDKSTVCQQLISSDASILRFIQLFSEEDKVNLLQDSFLLAYKGVIDYTEPLGLVNSLMNIDSSSYVIWRTFQWHWDTLAHIIQYSSAAWIKFKVEL